MLKPSKTTARLKLFPSDCIPLCIQDEEDLVVVEEDATPEEEDMDDTITTQGMSELIVYHAKN